jgi:hypothetical protein
MSGSTYRIPIVIEPYPEGGFGVRSPLFPELISEGTRSRKQWNMPKTLLKPSSSCTGLLGSLSLGKPSSRHLFDFVHAYNNG